MASTWHDHAPEPIRNGRLWAAVRFPYFSTAVFSLGPFIPVEGLMAMAGGPIAVDRHGRIYYDPSELERWPPARAAILMIHEAGHLFLNHFERFQKILARALEEGLDEEQARELWNLAADASLNHALRAGGLFQHDPELEQAAVFPERLGVQPGTAEAIFMDLLGQHATARPPSGTASGRKGMGGGSASDGVPRPWEAPAPDHPDAPPGLDPSRMEAIRADLASQIGSLPGLNQLIVDQEAGLVNWRAALRAFLSQARWGGQRLDWSRPPRGRTPSVRHPIVYPRYRSPVIEPAVVLDTSGSMETRNRLRRAAAEVARIVSEFGRARVVIFDADAHAVIRASGPRQIYENLIGGGGTAMEKAIPFAAGLRPRPPIVICITDGETNWPPRPGVPVIICLVNPDPNVRTPDWAITIQVTD